MDGISQGLDMYFPNPILTNSRNGLTSGRKTMHTLWGTFPVFILNCLKISRWVGLCYALSQGFLTKLLMRYTGEDPTNLILLCLGFLSLGRVLAMITTSLAAVYVVMAVVIIALGVVNTAMASACARLAEADEVIPKNFIDLINIL